jgi:hypothetical protein
VSFTTIEGGKEGNLLALRERPAALGENPGQSRSIAHGSAKAKIALDYLTDGIEAVLVPTFHFI